MKTSQRLISTVAALAVVGAAGFALAQTTTTDKPTTDPMQAQPMTPNATQPSTPAAPSANSNSTSIGSTTDGTRSNSSMPAPAGTSVDAAMPMSQPRADRN